MSFFQQVPGWIWGALVAAMFAWALVQTVGEERISTDFGEADREDKPLLYWVFVGLYCAGILGGLLLVVVL
jgi:hypothetical protein